MIESTGQFHPQFVTIPPQADVATASPPSGAGRLPDSVDISGRRDIQDNLRPKIENRPFAWHEGLKQAKANVETGAAAASGGALIGVASAIHGMHGPPRVFDGTTDLKLIADRVLEEKGLATDFPASVKQQVSALKPARPTSTDAGIRDQRNMLWCSIDNGVLDPKTLELINPSMDLDQLTVAERLDNGRIRVYVAIADVDALVPKGSDIDQHAMTNGRTVYTPEKIYPMLPERLSTDLTSLAPGEDRLANVKEYIVNADGTISDEKVYRSWVNNHGKMAYDSVAAWLDGSNVTPKPISDVPGMADQIRMQDEAAQRIKKVREEKGSLEFADREMKADVQDGQVIDIHLHQRNRATDLIENFMIAANQVTARFLANKGYPSLRRVVKTPENWDDIVQVARERGTTLPDKPDSKALGEFLAKQKVGDPDHYPDLSLTVIKLIGRGEYVFDKPGDTPPGHFCLAVQDYAHSTAPNRRAPDLVGQRIEKAAIAGKPCPYSDTELTNLALHFTDEEHEVKAAERQINKSATAKFLQDQHRLGDTFQGIVTGASEKGTWVRVPDARKRGDASLDDPIPIEGKIVQNTRGLKVGDKVPVKLISLNVEKGFIDFAAVQR